MAFARLAFTLLILLAGSAWAQEQAFTNRSTELKERAGSDARTLTTLASDTPVKVLQRGGGWTRVEAGQGQAGWVRVFHLRFPAVAEASSSSGGGALSGLTSALGFGRQKTQQATIATTGIRGLSQEDINNANPDPESLRRLQSYQSDKPGAERFARDGKLTPQRVEDNEGGRR
jgi:SH3 domain-containing protein